MPGAYGSPTFKIISQRVGDGGKQSGGDVKRVQQLLLLTGATGTGAASGTWGPKWSDALRKFLAKAGRPESGGIDPWVPYGDLWALCLVAEVLIPLPGIGGPVGVEAFYQTCVHLGLPYGYVKDEPASVKMLWGVDGDPTWGVFTTSQKLGTLFEGKPMRRINCTAFANAMMSIWLHGNLHHAPYTAFQSFGGLPPLPLLGDQYNYPYSSSVTLPRPGFVRSADSIRSMTRPGELYYLGSASQYPTTGFVTHETVLLNGFIYESNKGGTISARKTELDARFKEMKVGVLMGPAPLY